ncbi:hypothetical protein ACWDTI_23915 [Gordonia sp. NPDC003424]
MSAAILAVVTVVVGCAGWFAYRWFDAGMSSVHVTEDADEAARIAEQMGVRLNGSDIEYGRVTSQFQGWLMAYVVANAGSVAVRDRIIRESRLHCAVTDPKTLATLPRPSRHGPPPTTTLMTCVRAPDDYGGVAPARERVGDLTVRFDPEAGDRSTWLYISAIPD